MTGERFVAGIVGALLFAALIVLVQRRRRTGQPANDPATVFMAIWGGTFLLFAVPVIDYVSTPAATWLVIYGSVAAFLTGGWLAYRLGKNATKTVGRREHLSTTRINAAWMVTGFLSVVGFAFFVHAIDVSVGWQTMFQDPGAARAAQHLPQFENAYGPGKAFSYLGPVSLLLWTVAFRDRHFKGNWRFAAAAIVFVLLPYFFTGERLSLLFALVWIISFHFVWRPVANTRQVVFGIAIAVVASLAFFYVIGNQKGATVGDYPSIRAAVTNPALEPIAFPYMYATANLPVLGQLTQDPLAPTTYGQLTARPASVLAHRVLPLTGSPPEQGAFYGIPFSSYNSATWLDPFYRDFGMFGALVLPAVIGFLATWTFLVARRRRTLVSSWIAAIGLAFVVFSPLKSLAPDALTWELLLLAPFVGLMVSPDARKKLRLLASKFESRLSLDPRVVTALVTVVAFAAVGLTLLALQLGSGGSQPNGVTTKKLQSDAAKVVDAYSTVSPPADSAGGDTQSLTTRLGVSDTGTRYAAMPDAELTPSELGVIGVYADGGNFSLSTLAKDGTVRRIETVQDADGYRILPLETTPSSGGTIPAATSGQSGLASGSLDGAYEIRTPGLPSVVLAVALLVTAAWSLIRLPALHPLQFWSVPWCIAAFCFVLGLLPFIAISWLTVGLILGATAALGAGVAGGERWYGRRISTPTPADTDSLRALFRHAALFAIGLTAVLLLAFLVQLALRFGIRAALIGSSEVRTAIGDGDFAITVKYIYANLAAIALTGSMTGLAARNRLSKGWLAVLLLLIAATYFTTARSNVFLAFVVAGVAFLTFSPYRLNWKSVTAGVATILVAGLTIFVMMGSTVGKEFDNYPDFREVPNFFQEGGRLSTLAIPYRYLSSSIPAFELQVEHSSIAGQTHGCAMFSEGCEVLQEIGLSVDPVPRVKEFTAPYFEWNTYTGLDLPLIDFGKLFLVPIFALIGILTGIAWAAAQRLRALGGTVYALLAGCLVGGYSTFFFTAPHIVGAILIAVGCLGVAWVVGRLGHRRQANIVNPEGPVKIST